MTLFRRLALVALVLLCLPAVAFAAEAKTFAVAPFTIHGPEKYQYLSQGVQSMLESRMTWPGHLAPMDKGKVMARVPKAPASDAEAKKALTELGADYLAYCAMTISGDQASVDIAVLGRDGKKWPKTVSTKLGDLIRPGTTDQSSTTRFSKVRPATMRQPRAIPSTCSIRISWSTRQRHQRSI
jgi:hypothetical protein